MYSNETNTTLGWSAFCYNLIHGILEISSDNTTSLHTLTYVALKQGEYPIYRHTDTNNQECSSPSTKTCARRNSCSTTYPTNQILGVLVFKVFAIDAKLQAGLSDNLLPETHNGILQLAESLSEKFHRPFLDLLFVLAEERSNGVFEFEFMSVDREDHFILLGLGNPLPARINRRDGGDQEEFYGIFKVSSGQDFCHVLRHISPSLTSH